jgi:alkylation response protein AidB-like acyl-CoA dehydrogenase
MDFRFSPEDEALRTEAAEFVRKEWDPHGYDFTGFLASWRTEEEERGETRDLTQEFEKKLVNKGWYTMHWPKEHGGKDVPISTQLAFREVMAYEEAPASLAGGFIAPVLMVHGSDWQKEYFLPKIANADIGFFGQGFSEPNAGSDLASLETRAVRDGDDYVLNGQKIWSGYRSEWIHLLARTDPNAEKHRGISYFLINMRKEGYGDPEIPGATVREVQDGLGLPRWQELFLDNVRVPARNLIGEENRGWYAAMTTLSFERSNIAQPASLLRHLEKFIDYCREWKRLYGSSPLDDDVARNQLAEWRVQLETARMVCYRVAWMQGQGLVPQKESSMTKLWADILFTGIYRTCARLLQEYGNLRPDSGIDLPLDNYLPGRAYMSGVVAVAGGTDEIQRNIIAQRGLGLPR